MHIVTTPPTNADNTPNARAALIDDDTPSMSGTDAKSEYETHMPEDRAKLNSPVYATLMLPPAVVVATLMKRQEDTANDDRTNPVKDRNHSVTLYKV